MTFTCAGNETSSLAGQSPTYPAAGAWWAGDDRAAALNTLIQQTITYMRDTKAATSCCGAKPIYVGTHLLVEQPSDVLIFAVAVRLDGELL